MKCKKCGKELLEAWQALAGCPVCTFHHKPGDTCKNPGPEWTEAEEANESWDTTSSTTTTTLPPEDEE